MDIKNIVVLFVKLSGLVFVIWAIIDTASAAPLLIGSPGETTIAYGFSLLFELAIGGALWFFPVAVSNTVITQKVLVENTEQFFNEARRVAVMLLGLYLLYEGLSDLLYNLTYQHFMHDVLGNQHSSEINEQAKTAAALGEIVIALGFVLGAKAIVKFIRRVWGFGRTWPAD